MLPISDPDEVTDDGRRRVVTLTVHRPGHQPLLVQFARSGGGYAPIGVRVADEDGTLSSADLVGLRLAALAVYAWHASVLIPVEVGSRLRSRVALITPDPSDVAFTPPPGGRGRPLNDDRVQQAAHAWNQGKADRVNVKHAVADALHVSTAQASVYIRAARDQGLIPPTQKKKG